MERIISLTIFALGYVNEVAVVLGIIVFIGTLLSNTIQGHPNRLEDLLIRVLAASAIPTGFVLILCGFKPTLLAYTSGLNIHIALSGLGLLYLSYKGIVGLRSSKQLLEKTVDIEDIQDN